MYDYFKWFIEFMFGVSMLLNAASFIPQAVKIYKTKEAKGLSLLTFIGFNFVQFVTMLHGYINEDYILVFGIMLSFVFCGVVTFLIFYYNR